MNEIGLWSPNDTFLPSVDKDTKSAIFYVSEPGQIDGLNETFKAGDWLIYINKDGEENWFKSDSISVFNTSTSANAPDPGTYTKVRLDNSGRIIDASFLEASDIPSHQHKFSDIQSQELKNEIINVVSAMFVNKENSSVKISFDENTNTFSAEAVLDEITLDKNEFGEISFIGEAGGPAAPSVPKTIQIKDVKNLSEKIAELEDKIKENSRVYRAGLEDKNGEVSVKVDGLTIYFNEEGELAARGGGDLDADDLACGEHTHTSSSIEDFEDAVKSIIDEHDRGPLHVSDIPIDNDTIIINNNGELSAVAMKTQPHTHVMKDIKDLDPNKADVWASEQFLRGQSNEGQHDFTNISIGNAVDILNKDSKALDNRIDEIEDRINKTVAPEPSCLDKSDITLSGPDELQVYDVIDNKQVKAYTGIYAVVSSFYAKKSTVRCYINDKEMVTIYIDQNIREGAVSNSTEGKGQLQVLDVKDSYQGIALYEGFYKSISISYKLSNMLEGIYSIKFTQQLEDGTVLESIDKTFNIYQEHTGSLIKNLSISEGEYKYVSGIKYRTSPVKAVASPVITNAFKSRFINQDLLFFEDTLVPIKSIDLENKKISFNNVDISIDKVETNTVKSFYVNWIGNRYSYSETFRSYLYDDTEIYIEEYRTTLLKEDETSKQDSWDPYKTNETLITVYNYDVTKPLAHIEPYIVNNITSNASKDFTNFGGPNYSARYTDSDGYRWMQFRFPVERFRNMSIELVGPNKMPFEINRFGCLEDFKLFIGLAPSSDMVSKWIDGNKPYNGNSSINDSNDIFPGLDLFKSSKSRRQITIGNKPYDRTVSHLFVRIGLKKDIDCKVLIDSIRNSIYE